MSEEESVPYAQSLAAMCPMSPPSNAFAGAICCTLHEHATQFVDADANA